MMDDHLHMDFEVTAIFLNITWYNVIPQRTAHPSERRTSIYTRKLTFHTLISQQPRNIRP
jgi:hypothetical protein